MKTFLALFVSILLSGTAIADTLYINGQNIGEGTIEADASNNAIFVFNDGSHMIVTVCGVTGLCVVRTKRPMPTGFTPIQE